MNRKSIKDEEGQKIMQFLVDNTTLEKLELEGNRLGPRTANMLGEVLKKNAKLRHIDIDGNDLTDKMNNI